MTGFMATWISKDTSKPYYGKEVTSVGGKVVPVSSSTKTASKTSDTYLVSVGGKTAKVSAGVAALLQKEPVYQTTSGIITTQPEKAEAKPVSSTAGQSQLKEELGKAALKISGVKEPARPVPTIVSKYDYNIGVGSKNMQASPALASKFAGETATTPIYPTPKGATTSAAEFEKYRTLKEVKPASGIAKATTGLRGSLAETAGYSTGLIKSSLSDYDTDISSTPFVRARIEEQKSTIAKGYLRLSQIRTKEDNVFKGADIALTKSSIFLSKQTKAIYEKPATLGAMAVSSYALGYGAGALFSGTEGYIAVASQAWRPAVRTTAQFGMAGLKGVAAGSFVGGTYLEGRQEYFTKGTLVETGTRASFGLMGAAAGSKAFKVEKQVSDVRQISESTLYSTRKETGVKMATDELVKGREIISRDVLKFGGKTILESKKYTTTSITSDIGGVFTPKEGERFITAKETVTTYLEKKGAAKPIGAPQIRTAKIALTDLELKTTRPTIITAKGKYLPAMKGTPTIISAFEARLSTGEVVPGVQKSYVLKGPDIGGFEFTAVRSRTYISTPRTVPKGYELMTKPSLEMGVTGAITPKGYPTYLPAVRPGIREAGTSESIIGTIARGGVFKAYESTALYRKDLTITKEIAPKKVYEFTTYTSTTVTKPIGTRTSEGIINQFKRVYPQTKKTIVVFETGKDITPKGTDVTGYKKITIPGTKQITAVKTTTKSRIKGAGAQAIAETVFDTKGITKTTTAVTPITTLSTGRVTRTATYTPQSYSLASSTITRTAISPVTAIRLDMQPVQIQTTRQALRVDTVTRTGTGTATPVSVFTGPSNIIEVPPPGVLMPSLPSLALPLQLFGPSKKGRVKFRPKYFASLKATAFGIKGKMPNARAISTGLATRPIIGR